MNTTQEPIDYLKSLLGIPEYTEVNSIATEAIDEIETLRAAVADGPSERERKFLERMNQRDEDHSQAFAEWLESRSITERNVVASTRILKLVIDAMDGCLCNYSHAIDGHGKRVPIIQLCAEVTMKAEAEFKRVTKIDPREHG
jgi:hypothetical protein